MISIEVWSDFACPWCYLGASALNKLRDSHDVSIQWRAYEIRPAGTLITPEYKQRILQARERIREAALSNFDGLTFNGGVFGVNSKPAHIGMKFAESQGVGAAYHAAVMEHYWQNNADISDIAQLTAAATQAGLDPDAFVAALDQPDLQAAVQADVEQAFQYGIGGVPSMIFIERHLLNGAHPYPTLVKVVEQLESTM